jgi:DNA-directed RNA polymerase III subunit RPC3
VLRNRRLVELVNSRIGETTSYIYAELLRMLEDQTPRCKLDHRIDDTTDLPDGPSITTQELADALSTSINVSTGIGKASAQRIDTSKADKVQNGRKRKAADEAEVEGEASSDEESEEDAKPAVNGKGHAMEIDEDSDDPFAEPFSKSAKKRAVTFQDQLSKPAPVMNHLQLLAADDCHLLRKCGNRGLGEWTVDYDRVIERLKEIELDAIIHENFGKTGHRLTRIMRKMGKLEEKQLSVLGLIKQKDVRTKLVEMQMAGFVDIQEVPRDAGRTISRTVFLWFFDQDRVSAILLDRIYKTMSRCLQRLDIEKRRKANIVALAERTDVQEQGEDILRPEQLNQLQEIRAKEEDLLGQIGRLDDLAGVFYDY